MLVVVGLAVGAEATTFDVAFLTDPVGPKALPLVSALVFVVAGVTLALGPPGRRGAALPEPLSTPEPPPAPTPARPGGPQGTRIATAVGAFLLYAGALPTLGFWLATTGVVGALSRLYGGPRRGSWLAAGALAAALWALFVPLLGLPLPIGTLWLR